MINVRLLYFAGDLQSSITVLFHPGFGGMWQPPWKTLRTFENILAGLLCAKPVTLRQILPQQGELFDLLLVVHPPQGLFVSWQGSISY